MAKVTIFCDKCGKGEDLVAEPCNRDSWNRIPLELNKTRSINVPDSPEKVMLCEECRKRAEELIKSAENNLSICFAAFMDVK